ncbi:MAG: hemerythrin [Rhodospirillaceae bacterium]|nr:hemerythrin [Rhodospirillaceae bacterium]|tara:strand:+ start:782 stop:1357 length:576 start_codon:yes stop_codon:yes gene_type:complete
MSETIDKLRTDHRNLARLMDIIAREVRVFEAGDLPDYDLVASILDYTQNYPDRYHHPLEDRVLAKLRQRDPDIATTVGDLDQEHEKLGTLTRRFAAALDNVMQDAELPRDGFVEVASEYLDFQRRHMQMEEVLFFPAALRALSDDDWRELATDAPPADDPLFGGTDAQGKYDALLEEIMKWSKPQDTASFA